MAWDEDHPDFFLDETEFYGEDPQADSAFWSAAPCWTLEEATALSFGLNPSIVNWAFLRTYTEHPFSELYRQRLELIKRAQLIGDLDLVNRPGKYTEWAPKVGFSFPADIVEAIKARGANVRDQNAEYVALSEERNVLAAEVKQLHDELTQLRKMEKPLTESERRAVLTIISAIGKYVYGYNPRKNSTAAQDLTNDIAKVGLHLDVKTARKWLNEASRLLPAEDGL